MHLTTSGLLFVSSFLKTAAALLVSQLLHHGVAIQMPTPDLLDAVQSAFNDLEQVRRCQSFV